MKRRLLQLSLALMLFLSACGTIQLEVLTQPTPSATPVPPVVTPPDISPEQCAQFVNDSTLPENPDDPRSYIGHHYDELNMPQGLVFNGGGLLKDDYIWEWVSRPDFDMQFISHLTCRTPSGFPYNTVVDAIIVPRPMPGYDRASICTPVAGSNPVIVFGHVDQSQPQTVLLGSQGWMMYDLDFGQQIDLQTMQFRPLLLAGMQCLYMSGMGS